MITPVKAYEPEKSDFIRCQGHGQFVVRLYKKESSAEIIE